MYLEYPTSLSYRPKPNLVHTFVIYADDPLIQELTKSCLDEATAERQGISRETLSILHQARESVSSIISRKTLPRECTKITNERDKCHWNCTLESLTVEGVSQYRESHSTGSLTAQGVSQHRESHSTGSLTVQGVSHYRESHSTGSLTVQGVSQYRESHSTGSLTVQGVSQYRESHSTGSLTVQGVSQYRESHSTGSLTVQEKLKNICQLNHRTKYGTEYSLVCRLASCHFFFGRVQTPYQHH